MSPTYVQLVNPFGRSHAVGQHRKQRKGVQLMTLRVVPEGLVAASGAVEALTARLAAAHAAAAPVDHRCRAARRRPGVAADRRDHQRPWRATQRDGRPRRRGTRPRRCRGRRIRYELCHRRRDGRIVLPDRRCWLIRDRPHLDGSATRGAFGAAQQRTRTWTVVAAAGAWQSLAAEYSSAAAIDRRARRGAARCLGGPQRRAVHGGAHSRT